jgi:hypothetical protein
MASRASEAYDGGAAAPDALEAELRRSPGSGLRAPTAAWRDGERRAALAVAARQRLLTREALPGPAAAALVRLVRGGACYLCGARASPAGGPLGLDREHPLVDYADAARVRPCAELCNRVKGAQSAHAFKALARDAVAFLLPATLAQPEVAAAAMWRPHPNVKVPWWPLKTGPCEG